MELNDIKVGDIFSEESHYTVLNINTNDITFNHQESNRNVTLSKDYVQGMLNTADQYTKVYTVGKEDKKDGTPGIRTIFENIKSSEVFTVIFTKQDTPKTKKKYLAELESQREFAVSLIDKAKKDKKSMAEAYKEALTYIQENPIKDYQEGEERVLRGYKIQFVSRDGKYRCIDMAIPKTPKETGERLVNINTIKSLVYNDIRYNVE